MDDVGRGRLLIGAQTMPNAVAPATPAAARGELLFLAPGDVTKGRVEPIAWMRTCEAYAQAGLAVTLVTLRVRRPDAISDGEVWTHFGIDQSFTIRSLPTLLASDSPT